MLKQVALLAEAEKVLEETMHENFKGDVIYFWGRLDMDGGVIGSNNALTFWSMCDILNGGNCRYIIWNITLYINLVLFVFLLLMNFSCLTTFPNMFYPKAASTEFRITYRNLG